MKKAAFLGLCVSVFSTAGLVDATNADWRGFTGNNCMPRRVDITYSYPFYDETYHYTLFGVRWVDQDVSDVFDEGTVFCPVPSISDAHSTADFYLNAYIVDSASPAGSRCRTVSYHYRTTTLSLYSPYASPTGSTSTSAGEVQILVEGGASTFWVRNLQCHLQDGDELRSYWYDEP